MVRVTDRHALVVNYYQVGWNLKFLLKQKKSDSQACPQGLKRLETTMFRATFLYLTFSSMKKQKDCECLTTIHSLMSYFVIVVKTAPMKKIVEIIILESGLVAFWLFQTL